MLSMAELGLCFD